MDKQKNILISPLYWGLGHAFRIIPVIRAILESGHKVFIAADRELQHIFSCEFGNITFFPCHSSRISYSSDKGLTLMILIQLPKIFKNVYLEHRKLNKIIKNNHIDVVVSDNRYGMWSEKVRSILITHQLAIKMPGQIKFLEPFIHSLTKLFINKFDECWIPDFPGSENLSGELAHNTTIRKTIRFIGLLSRFTHFQAEKSQDIKYPYIAILSGPEPQRTIFEEKIINIYNNSTIKLLIVRGIISHNCKIRKYSDNIDILDFCFGKELYHYIIQSELIICRSGYSSLMDLVACRKQALLIPTPGQTEQEYLAGYLQRKGYFFTVSQDELQLGYEEHAKKYYPPDIKYDKSFLLKAIGSL